nr:hypothetical protein CFP56_37481 [Quercus suber]
MESVEDEDEEACPIASIDPDALCSSAEKIWIELPFPLQKAIESIDPSINILPFLINGVSSLAFLFIFKHDFIFSTNSLDHK